VKRAVVSLAILLAAAAPQSVAAQIEITPALGMYWPVGDLFTGDLDNGGETRQQVAAGMIGFRLAAWPTRRIGLEGGLSFSPSQVAVSRASGTRDITGSVVLANARAVVALSPRSAIWGFHAAAGVGVVHRSGSAWETTLGGTSPALTLAFGARSRMRRTNVTMRLELEDYILFDQFDQGLSYTTGARVHHEVMWVVGVNVPIF
jgi:hypothetical protein